MKIREQDFKNIPQKKEFVAVLKKLNSLPEDGNPHPYFEELMLLLSGHLAQDIVPTVYPYLVGFAVERSDFAYFNFIINLKVGFYLRVDLSLLSEQEIREYLGGMFHLRSQIGLVATEATLNMDEDFKSIYLWNAIMLYSNSPDVLALSRQGRFQKPFKVKCPHCDNDVHSLCINVDDMEHTSNITPVDSQHSLVEILFFDDIYSVFKPICDSFEEKYFSRVLPYVYGTYECSQCKQTSQVIEALKNYQFQEGSPFLPTREFLEKMENVVLHDESMHPTEQWMMTQFIVSGYRAIEGNYSLKALHRLLFISLKKHNMLGEGGDVFLLEGAEKILSSQEEKSPMRCQILYQLIEFLKRKTNQNDKILKYYEEIIALYTMLLGEEHEKTKMAQFYEKQHHASMYPEKEVELLAEYYENLDKTKENRAIEPLLTALVVLCCQQGRWEEAVLWKEKVLTEKKANYERNPFEYGVFMGEFAVIYEKNGDFKGSEEAFLQSLDLLMTGFISSHQLSASFLQEKRKKKVDEKDSLYQDVRIMFQTYTALGELYFRQNELEKSLKHHDMGMKLWEWLTDLRGMESGVSRLNQALVWQSMDDKKKAKNLAEKAVKLFEIRVKQEKDPLRLEEAKDGLERGKKLLERLK